MPSAKIKKNGRSVMSSKSLAQLTLLVLAAIVPCIITVTTFIAASEEKRNYETIQMAGEYTHIYRGIILEKITALLWSQF